MGRPATELTAYVGSEGLQLTGVVFDEGAKAKASSHGPGVVRYMPYSDRTLRAPGDKERENVSPELLLKGIIQVKSCTRKGNYPTTLFLR
jgi:hypothetical protein